MSHSTYECGRWLGCREAAAAGRCESVGSMHAALTSGVRVRRMATSRRVEPGY